MKRIISFFVCVCMCVLLSSTVFAEIEFDISVFENNPNYTVEFDEMDDTGRISMGDDTILTILPDDEGVLFGPVDVFLVEGFPPVVRIILDYIGEDAIFTEKVIIKADDVRYTFEVTPYAIEVLDSGEIHERNILVLTDVNFSLLEKVNSDEECARIRLVGDRNVDGVISQDWIDFYKLNKDYRASGALNNDFSMLYELYPCEIKDMSEAK